MMRHPLLASIPLQLLARWTVALQNSSQSVYAFSGAPPCNALIAAGLESRLLLPTDDAYDTAIETYWSVNARQHPWCLVQPHNAQEVSRALQALVHTNDGAGNWHIAIRSGGHSAQMMNNIDTGVTIDLSMMSSSSYNATSGLAQIEPGGRWKDVYASLLKYNVTTSGGRDGGVGVGGFLLGGGNTYYAGTTGFGCDSVTNYEVVLANGSIINANADEHADLWRALKGGGNNFGIVTRFDMTTKPAQNLSYDERVISMEHSGAFVDAVVDFVAKSHTEPDSHLIPFFTHQSTSPNETLIIAIAVNTIGEANSSVFNKLNEIPNKSSEQSFLSLADAAENSQIAGGTRNAGATLTLKNDPEVLRHVVTIHEFFISNVSTYINPQNFTTEWFFQPLPAYISQISARRGGNVLGLDRLSEDLIMWTGSIQLLSESDEDLAIAEMMMRMAVAEIGGEGFVFLNYADASQDPIVSYGEENVEFLKRVAKKYDPEGVFQRRVPGGFKLDVVGREM